MEWIESVAIVVVGLLVRFALPIAITLLVIMWLRWLDTRWQKQAIDRLQMAGQRVGIGGVRCWETKGCSPESRASCPAYQNKELPCWQVFREQDGLLREDCFGCDVFRLAPIPLAAGD
jgi:hypothetical protein